MENHPCLLTLPSGHQSLHQAHMKGHRQVVFYLRFSGHSQTIGLVSIIIILPRLRKGVPEVVAFRRFDCQGLLPPFVVSLFSLSLIKCYLSKKKRLWKGVRREVETVSLTRMRGVSLLMSVVGYVFAGNRLGFCWLFFFLLIQAMLWLCNVFDSQVVG